MLWQLRRCGGVLCSPPREQINDVFYLLSSKSRCVTVSQIETKISSKMLCARHCPSIENAIICFKNFGAFLADSS